MTGIEYPTISVGKHENLVVRLSLAAQLLMRRRGIDPGQIGEEMSPTKTVPNPNMRMQSDPPTVQIGNSGAVQAVITVFSCMVLDNSIDQSNPTKLTLILRLVPTTGQCRSRTSPKWRSLSGRPWEKQWRSGGRGWRWFLRRRKRKPAKAFQRRIFPQALGVRDQQ